MWIMDEDKALGGGCVLNIHAAGPHPPFEDLYVFVMDRRELPYSHLGAQPRLTGLTFAGGRAEAWRDNLSTWLGAPRVGDELEVGDVTLRFRAGRHPNARVSLTFAVPGAGEVVPLAAGELELVGGRSAG
jgi:hypothetical protein